MKGNDFMEVVADPKSGTIAKAEKITDADDLKAAASQKAAMAKAKGTANPTRPRYMMGGWMAFNTY